MTQGTSPNGNRRQLANWVTDYANLLNKISESPSSFNVWAAISAISAVLKNRVYINRSVYTIHPNQYIVLVGPPGVGKGNAINPAHTFVKDPPTNIPLANYIQDRITAPKLCETLSNGFPSVHFTNGNLINGKDTSCILQATELATLLNSSDWMSTLLTETWDKDSFVYDTKGGGKKPIKNMCISLIGACTPDFIKLLNKNNGDPVNNGLTARMVFVYASKKSQSIVWPKGFKYYQTEVDKLNADLQTISQMSGEYFLDKTAMVLFERKYMEIQASVDEGDSDVVRNFKARQEVHILKVAMALSAAGRSDMVISDWAMSTAITLIDGVLATLDNAFRGIGESPLAVAQDRLHNYVAAKGVVSRTEMMKDNHRHITPDDMDRVVYILTTCGFVQEFTQAGKKYFKYLGKGTP
jgi:hypothetical protein